MFVEHPTTARPSTATDLSRSSSFRPYLMTALNADSSDGGMSGSMLLPLCGIAITRTFAPGANAEHEKTSSPACRMVSAPRRVFSAVKIYKVDDQRIRVLNDAELHLVLSTQADAALMCRVTLVSLNRISEVLGLRREHIGASWMEVRRKGGKVHRVALPESLRTALLDRCHARSGYVFGEGKDGEPPTQQTASNRVIRAVEAVGVTDVSHHTMRHTGVTLMLEHGIVGSQDVGNASALVFASRRSYGV